METKDIERNLVKKFRKDIWAKFIKGIKEYNLIEPGDKIAICISGGKDSFLLAKLMQELKRHGQIDFELEFISMDPGYNEENRELILSNSKKLNIPLIMFKSDIFKVVDKISKEDPCYLCARMRRGHLYDKAKELGCNKIALGHHFDDVIETIMMNMLYNGQVRTMMPKLKSKNFENMELIRPLYFVDEKAIGSWVSTSELTFIRCGCPLGSCVISGKRSEVKYLIKELAEKNPFARKNIFSASTNINLDAVIGYKKCDETHNFLDEYYR